MAKKIEKKKKGGIVTYFKSAYEELKKVNWPTQDEVINLTFVIVIFIILVAVALGFADVISFKLIDWIFSL